MSFFRSKTAQPEYNNENVVNTDPLAVIFNEGQWKLSKVSPLYDLQYTAIKLKQYASKIRQEVVSSVRSNAAMQYNVQVEGQPFLKFFDEDPEGILITVTSCRGDSQSKTIYSGILLSWGVNTRVESATYLPYLLERGEQRIGTSVKACLQRMFDCNIIQFVFTQQQLLHFMFRCVENDTSRNTDSLVLSYKTPQVDNKNKLSFTFDIGDVRYIWHKVHNEEDEAGSVNVTYQFLQNQIFEMMMFNISILNLTEFASSKFEVKSNGVVKMKTPELVNAVLTVLNNIDKNNYAIYASASKDADDLANEDYSS